MRQEQEQYVEELQKVECNWNIVRKGQSRVQWLKLERQRWYLVGTCRERTGFYLTHSGEQLDGLIKERNSLISVLESSEFVFPNIHEKKKKEKGTTEDEMVGWHHRLNGHGFGWTPGVGDGQGGLACWGSWGHKESDTTERLNWTELNIQQGQAYLIHLCKPKHLNTWDTILWSLLNACLMSYWRSEYSYYSAYSRSCPLLYNVWVRKY